MRDPNTYRPKVPLWRRGCAFGIDLLCAWLVASLFGSNWFGQLIGFFLAWFGLRVAAVNLNRGQSLGRWAFDMKVLEEEFNRIPSSLDLVKREGVLGLAAFLAISGFVNLATRNAFYLLLLLPLAADLGFAWLEPSEQQAFHDRLAKTEIVGTRRGFSLDLKLKRWTAIALQSWKK